MNTVRKKDLHIPGVALYFLKEGAFDSKWQTHIFWDTGEDAVGTVVEKSGWIMTWLV